MSGDMGPASESWAIHVRDTGGAEAALTSIKDIWSASTCRVGDGEKGPTCG